MTSGIAVWATRATAWLDAWGPIAWVTSGIIGVLIFLSFAGICISLANRMLGFSIKRKLLSKADAVNPMDIHFLNKRIVLVDLFPPAPGAVEGKTFEGCDIIGPLNILPFNTPILKCTYVLTDYIAISMDAYRNNRINNARVLRDCNFRQCRFYGISILVNENEYAAANSWGGCNWITGESVDSFNGLTPKMLIQRNES